MYISISTNIVTISCIRLKFLNISRVWITKNKKDALPQKQTYKNHLYSLEQAALLR